MSPPELIDAWWRAANYLSVGQIYLLDNPLLRAPLELEHIKPRLLGHWGTTPGLNFIYAHLNRVIKARDLDMIYIAGPGHGGPGMVANAWLEGTYSETYPQIARNAAGMQRLFKQFSFPGGIPSHVAPETPGSIHEGGELGYALSHAYGAAFDNPDLIVAAVVGDGEAETGPMATSWHSNKFLNPMTDGAVLPILHLNGYKIASPAILARIGADELRSLFTGYGYRPYLVEGDEPAAMHQLMAATLDQVLDEIRSIQSRGAQRSGQRPPALADDHPEDAEGLDRSEGSGRPEDRGHLALAPGAVGRDGNQARACEAPAGLDAELSPGRTVRPGRRTQARDRRAGADRRPAHERQPACQWRSAAAGSRSSRHRRLCGQGRGAGRRTMPRPPR